MLFGFIHYFSIKKSLPVLSRLRCNICLLLILASLFGVQPAFGLLQAADDSRAVPANTPILIDVLNNDVSDDGVLNITQFTQPAQGVVTQSGGGLRYQPNQDFTGQDQFTYTLQNTSETAVATVFITVSGQLQVVDVLFTSLTMAAMASESMASHRHALNQFARIGSSFAALNRHAIPLAGLGAGDSLMPAGGFFVSVNSRSTEQSATDFQRAYDGGLSGFTLGADFVASSRWFLGGAFGYSQGHADFISSSLSLDKIENQEVSVITMINYQGDALLAQMQLGYSLHSFDGIGTAVNTIKPGLNEVAQVDGDSQFVHASVDYAFAFKGWQLMPSAGLIYERANFADTAVIAQTLGNESAFGGAANSHWQGLIGLHVDYAATFTWGVLLPQLTLSHEIIMASSAKVDAMADENIDVEQAFYNDKSQLRVDAGMAWILPHGVSGFVNYQQLTGNDDYTTRGLQAGMRWEF